MARSPSPSGCNPAPDLSSLEATQGRQSIPPARTSVRAETAAMKHLLKSSLLVVLALQAGAAGGPPSAGDDRPAVVTIPVTPGQASLYRSEDAGTTWTAIGLGDLGVSAIAI